MQQQQQPLQLLTRSPELLLLQPQQLSLSLPAMAAFMLGGMLLGT